ncbi:MAG: methyltransferase domain-containing protein [Bacteroidales bacterium]|nr:methyltransferase domain-containing protein [Bacteroidales bacterium]
MIKDKPIPNIIARIMFKMHSSKRLKNEIAIIKSGLIKPDDRIMDFACGPGNLSLEMAKETGAKGIVYALDIHPLAIKSTEKLIDNYKVKNIRTILTDKSETGLDNNTIDIVFIFNAIDMIQNKKRMINEIERVLKPGGKLIIRNKKSFRLNTGYYKNLFNGSYINYLKQEDRTFHYYKN